MPCEAIRFSSIGGFSLPEERVIGESTYIVLDFPRCVDSVEVGGLFGRAPNPE